MEPWNDAIDRAHGSGLPEQVHLTVGDLARAAADRLQPPHGPAVRGGSARAMSLAWTDKWPEAPDADPTITDAVATPARLPRQPSYRRQRSLRRRAGLVLLILLAGVALGWMIAGMPL